MPVRKFTTLFLLLVAACSADARPKSVSIRRVEAPPVATSFDLAFAMTTGECDCPTTVSGTTVGLPVTTPVTVARTSGAYCTRGVLTRVTVTDAGGYIAGISTDAGMVFCPANTLRTMSGSSTGLGFLSEGSMLNYAYGSQDLDGPDWSIAGLNGAAAPTETANAAVAPNGTMTAERYEFPATTGALSSGGRSIVYPAALNAPPPSVCAGQKTSGSLYAKAHTTAPQVLGITIDDTDGPGGFRTFKCVLTSTTQYTRCLLENITVTGGGGASIIFGTLSYYDGTDYAAADVDVWGVQGECNDHATSYYPTTVGAVATRGLDAVTATLPFVPSGANLIVSAEVAAMGTLQGSRVAVSLESSIIGGSGTNYFSLGVSSDKKVECLSLVTNTTDTFVGPLYASGANSASCKFDGDTTVNACLNSTCTAGTITGSNKPTRAVVLGIGAKWNGAAWIYQPNEVVKNIHLRVDAAKILALFGDSIIAGTYVNNDAKPQGVIRTFNRNAVAVENGGVGGYAIEATYASWTAELANIVAAGLQARTTMVVASGTNSGAAPADGGTAITNVSWHLQQMLYAARDAGVSSYATTLVARSGEATFIDGVNNTMAAWAVGAEFTPIDSWTPTVNPARTGLADTCDLPDTVHLNDAGTYVLAYKICSTTGVCSVPVGSCQ